MTLVGDPRLIFLDEPTTGLDPRSRRMMWQLIRDLVAGGVTVFLTTQYLEEADQLADRIALLDRGRAGRRGHRGASSSGWSPAATSGCEFADPDGLDARGPRARPGGRRRARPQVPSDGSVAALRTVARAPRRRSIAVAGLTVDTPDLDDVFLDADRQMTD